MVMVKMSKEYSKIIAECEHEPILDEAKGEYICCKCGLVIEKQYVSPIYQMHNENLSENNVTRHYVALGKRLNMVDGLGSFIDYQYNSKFSDASGNMLSAKKQVLYKRLKYFYDIKARIVNNETNYNIFNTLNRVISNLNLNDSIRDRSAYFYNKIISNISKENFTNHVLLIAMCIFLAIREHKHNAPITIQELSKAFNDLGHRVSPRTIIREIQKVRPYLGKIITTNTRRSEDYINKIISKVFNYSLILDRLIQNNIEIDQYKIYLRNKSYEILKKIDVNKRGGRNPYIFAVAVVYTCDQIYSKKRKQKSILTQKLLSEACNCAEYSIRDHFKYIRTNFSDLLYNQIS